MSMPTPKPDDEYWEKLHSVDFNFPPGCWEHCGSYCCKSNSPHFSFALMKEDSAGMIFMPGEYEYLKRINQLQNGIEEAAVERSFTYGTDKTIRFYTSVCALGGQCSHPEHRPLICKVYPILPHLDETTGRILDFSYSSALDLYWKDIGIPHPCWLFQNHRQQLEEGLRQRESLFSHPYLIFYLGVARLFLERLHTELVERQADLFSGDPKSFFSHWEILYLRGAIVDIESFRSAIYELHQKIVEHHGEFEL